MPITLTVTDDVMPETALPVAIARITDAFLGHHGLRGNAVMTRNVTAHVSVLKHGTAFAGGKVTSGAWIELKVPSFALADRAVQRAFFADATHIIHELSGGKLPKDQIWTNALHTVDGTWNMNGNAMTNAELGTAIAA